MDEERGIGFAHGKKFIENSQRKIIIMKQQLRISM